MNNSKKKECPDGKILNPKTNRCVNKNGTTAKKILTNKKTNKIEKECPDGKILNPKTNRCVNKNGTIAKKLLLIKKNSKLDTKPNELDAKPNSLNTKAKIIQRKFRNFIYPFINRVSANIYDRRVYYNLILKNIDYDPSKTNYCMRFYKYDDKGQPLFRIGDKLILKKKIGSPSVNAIVYLSNFRDKNKKLFKFVIKVSILGRYQTTTNEAIVLKKLSNLALKDICPHFPILYATLKCNNFLDFNKSPYLTSDSNSQNSLKKNYINNLKIYPEYIQKKKYYNMLIFVNELANGDLKMFVGDNYNNGALLENALAQIYFSLMFFHRETYMFHGDSHWGNFLYHKIKPGGYFHYKIFNDDYYIENLGYLWVIYDFDFSNYFNIEGKKIQLDFYRIIHAFITNNYKARYGIEGWPKKINIYTEKKIFDIYKYLFIYNSFGDVLYTPTDMNIFIRKILFILHDNDFIKSSFTIKDTDVIINKIPYYLNLYA